MGKDCNCKDEKCKKDKLDVVIGDKSDLDISDVGDCLNELRPKNNKSSNKIIPQNKK